MPETSLEVSMLQGFFIGISTLIACRILDCLEKNLMHTDYVHTSQKDKKCEVKCEVRPKMRGEMRGYYRF